MLYPNGQRIFTAPQTRRSGVLVTTGAMAYGGIGGARFNRFVSETYSKVVGAVPSGYGARAYIMSPQAGGLTAFAGLTVTPTASGVLGLPTSGSTSITFTVADATGQLIASGNGSAAFSITALPLLLTASLNGIGSTSFTLATNTPLLGAKAGAVGTTSFAITGTLTPYAIGSMSGSTVDTSSIVNANIVSVNGYSITGNGKPGTEWGPA